MDTEVTQQVTDIRTARADAPAGESAFGAALPFLALLVVGLAFPLFGGGYWGVIATRACVYWVLVSGLNLVVGFAGQIAIGWVALLTLGAYTTSVLATGNVLPALPGACTFDSAMSFALIRGGHVDMTVLGGLQVDTKGHLANWMIPGKMVPGMGGAMDLVTGAKRVVVAMQHAAKGKSKIVPTCSLPLTSVRPVNLVITDLAVIGFPNGRATLLERAPGVSLADIRSNTEADLDIPDHVPEMKI
jgi:acetate CoA/acetoacetate CoA-transferase beta subunit